MEPEIEQLAARLRALYEAIDENLRQEWQRSLPFQDALIDRWDRARRLGFEADASIYNSAIVLGTVNVGASTWIGPSTLLDGSGGGIAIGSFCSISSGVHIYTHDTVAWSLSLGIAPRSEGAVSIGDGCYVGPQSVIAPGVTLGRQVVVGANSFVNRPAADRTIVAGTPARVIGAVEVDGAEVRLVYGPGDASP